ncbi:MAG: ClpXP protease specificity-enhancing factor [Pigmentiphaga sp.]|nr:ClpXP protease specificity-enhancing factor [Pigmentiphaga sp.]
MNEIPTKPYLLRALYEWCTDSGYTPHLAVVVDAHTRVPPEHVRDGQIVLNIGALATHKLVIGNEFIEFQARFGGVAQQISVPVGAVQAIYARETGQGMSFEINPEDAPAPNEADAEASGGAPSPALAAVPDTDSGDPPDDPSGGPDGGPASPARRPFLKVVK